MLHDCLFPIQYVWNFFYKFDKLSWRGRGFNGCVDDSEQHLFVNDQLLKVDAFIIIAHTESLSRSRRGLTIENLYQF